MTAESALALSLRRVFNMALSWLAMALLLSLRDPLSLGSKEIYSCLLAIRRQLMM